jgi:ATP-binding cassette subfamily B protein
VAYHNRAQTGQLLSRAIQDVERIRFLTGRASLRLVEGVILLLGTAAVLVWMNPHLALLAMTTMPLLVYRAFHFGRRSRPLSVLIQNQTAVLTTRLEQNLRGARTVKAFAQEEAEIAHFDRENERWFDLSAQHAHLQAVNIPMLDLIANIGTVFIIGYGRPAGHWGPIELWGIGGFFDLPGATFSAGAPNGYRYPGHRHGCGGLASVF